MLYRYCNVIIDISLELCLNNDKQRQTDFYLLMYTSLFKL